MARVYCACMYQSTRVCENSRRRTPLTRAVCRRGLPFVGTCTTGCLVTCPKMGLTFCVTGSTYSYLGWILERDTCPGNDLKRTRWSVPRLRAGQR
eukprot:7267130-Prymnesium_polylepis.1